MPLFGAHMSIAGGCHNALLAAQAHGCSTVQLFTKSSNQWKARELSEEDGEPITWFNPRRISRVAVRMRCSRRPAPGQPLAKVEKSRCKNSSGQDRKEIATRPKDLKAGPGDPTFGGDSAR